MIYSTDTEYVRFDMDGDLGVVNQVTMNLQVSPVFFIQPTLQISFLST